MYVQAALNAVYRINESLTQVGDVRPDRKCRLKGLSIRNSRSSTTNFSLMFTFIGTSEHPATRNDDKKQSYELECKGSSSAYLVV